MVIYILLLALILVFKHRLSNAPDYIKPRRERTYCIISWSIIVLLAALRSAKVGADTAGYMADYYNLASWSFSDITSQYEGYLGYYYLQKIFSMAKMPLQVWFGFVESVYAFAMFLLINRYSKDKLFSILVFVCCGLMMFSFAGLKQVLAMSFMMLAYLRLVDKKYLTMIGLVLLSWACHSVGLVFMLAFGMYLIRKKRYYYLLILGTVGLTYFSGPYLLTEMVDTLGEEHYEMYLVNDNSYSATTLIFYLILLAMSFMGYNNYKRFNKIESRIMYGFCIIACAFQILASISPNMFRLAFLYAPFYMVLMPNSCQYMQKRRANDMSRLMIISLIFYFLYTNRDNPYVFIWQYSIF